MWLPKVTDAVWQYIKANDLQNPTDRRRIVNDERMAKVFKCREMSMFQLAGKLTPNLKKCEDLVGFKDSPAAALKPPRSAKVGVGSWEALLLRRASACDVGRWAVLSFIALCCPLP